MDPLPIEVQYIILSFLDAHSLMKISIACKKLYLLSKDNLLWKNLLKIDYQISSDIITKEVYKEYHFLSEADRFFDLKLSFDKLKKLKKLSVSEKLKEIPDCLSSLTNLKELSFFNNQIKVIPDCFGSLINLKILSLSYNQIKVIPDCLSSLTNLKDLSLSYNQIEVIPNCLGSLTNLEELSLHRNQIKVIPECIVHLKSRGTTIYL